MSLIQAFILGLLQGATEYIPVSSSAHLVLFPWLAGWAEPPFTFDVLVQWGTLVGVIVYFGQDLWVIVRAVLQGLLQRRPFDSFEARLGWYLIVATIPAVVFGFWFKQTFEITYGQPPVAAALLLGTALMLVLAEYRGKQQRRLEQMGWWDALDVGLWQVAALLPGISRSGATISGAMLRDLERRAAARFSFLLSIPALLGAGFVATVDLVRSESLSSELPPLAVGFAVAAVSGYLCVRWLLRYLQGHRLTVFAAYCALLGVGCLVVALLRGG
ncbi:MAG: undecaprenyl-diphosphatase UppP [Anaerolineae bacterium]|nr:undecaprenyl-diphosphatase UppP [Anaerolineae bacterium]MDW8070222.1 undecaprenyl-diphosphatase UppP [Anaerolineae bacterium]